MKRRAIVMVAALALAGGACGGDDDSDVSSDTGAASDESSGDADSGDDNDDSGDAGAAPDESSGDADSGDDNDDSGDTGDLGDLGGTDEEIARQQVVSVFTLMGMTEDQANCVVDKIGLSDFETSDDLSQYADEFEDCGFDTGDLDDTGDLGDLSGTDEEIAREQMVRVFTLMGMTEEQANCVVDNIDLDELDNAASADPSVYFDLFDDCGFDLTNPGG